MKIEIWSIGKENDKIYKLAIEEFVKRINRYNQFKIVTIASKAIATTSIKEQINTEGEQINNLLKEDDSIIILDDKGTMLDTIQLANKIEKWLQLPCKRLIFIIGGAYGINDKIKQKSYFNISLSALTFPHQLVRLIFTEQIYRAFTVLNNEKYHHQ